MDLSFDLNSNKMWMLQRFVLVMQTNKNTQNLFIRKPLKDFVSFSSVCLKACELKLLNTLAN